MGLLDKKNPGATWKSVLARAFVSAIIGGVVFLAFKPEFIKAWRMTLPLWLLLCGAVGALWEWQGPNC